MKHNTQRSTAFHIAAGALVASLAFNAQAQDAAKMDHAGHDMSHAAEPTPAPAAAQQPAAESTQVMTDGEVIRINLMAGKVSIKHAAITNLNMPAMSMVFSLKNPADLTKLKDGDKVRFHVERENGALLITQIEVAAQ
ncbi:copper-binding protein [Diaphorobacter sp. HDW4B]|uniref:copper-binding protein n=1 Tax=Diaphorobacter sp. HDW4B TaxID=2714925 RepID=UPI001407850C|nr:copper-binding protein [Diaphorobacter sp. HDW4B]QIL72493.1 copper-binding protein [Diaphorobacter sp. HDW4B]